MPQSKGKCVTRLFEGKGGRFYIEVSKYVIVQRIKGHVAILRKRGDIAIMRERGDMGIVRERGSWLQRGKVKM